MSKNRIVQLGQIWPDGYRENKYWVGAILANVQHMGQPPVLGCECSTIAELEAIATQIKFELDEIVAEARMKLSARSN
jgi:hypothetical protein